MTLRITPAQLVELSIRRVTTVAPGVTVEQADDACVWADRGEATVYVDRAMIAELRCRGAVRFDTPFITVIIEVTP